MVSLTMKLIFLFQENLNKTLYVDKIDHKINYNNKINKCYREEGDCTTVAYHVMVIIKKIRENKSLILTLLLRKLHNIMILIFHKLGK